MHKIIKKKLRVVLILISLCAFINGCGNKRDEELALERSALIIRLFRSMDNSNHSATITQAQKLRSYYPQNIYLIDLIENETIAIEYEKIQELLAVNDLENAQKLLKDLNGLFPLNKEIKDNMEKISALMALNLAISNYQSNNKKEIELDNNFEILFPEYYPKMEDSINNLSLEKKEND